MIEMHTVSSILLFIFFLNNAVASRELLSKAVGRLSRVILDMSVSVPPMKFPPTPTHCIKIQCKFICINGKYSSLKGEILTLQDSNCEFIDELHLYNTVFPSGGIPNNFLGDISNNVKHLSIYASNVTYIENGAFESTVLTGLHLESLKLVDIHKGIFQNISEKFSYFTLIQREVPVEHVEANFLGYIKYQIKKIDIQSGLLTVENLTKSDCLLNNLEEVNLSFNNFGDSLTASSFVQLSVVEKLNLSHSGISSLPEFIFSDIAGTLRMLDLSNNKLAVISHNIFGWHELGKNLVIYLKGNPWACSCDLRTEMIVILAFQTELVYCEQSENVLVTDEKLCKESCATSDSEQCNGSSAENLVPVPAPPHIAIANSDEETESNLIQTSTEFETRSTTDTNGLARVECHKGLSSYETEKFSILWPNAQFDIKVVEGFKVEVEVVEVSMSLNGTYGILWFSNVTTKYYKMEVNHNEFGLGCFGIRQYVTTVENLLPDMAYTFCLVLKNELTVSPFSCKSVYINGNLDVKYNAWLTTNMKATGITLVVLGIVLCKFLGILCIFLLLKQKPTLVKGSKRVAMQKNDSTNIIVFPKDKTLQKFKMMEEKIAKQNLKGSDCRRLSSVSMTSMDSNQSYMNPISSNVYEIIPAYQRYLPTYAHAIEADISYADIPVKKKRTSNDPLPAIPGSSKLSPTVLNLRDQETCREYNLFSDGTNV